MDEQVEKKISKFPAFVLWGSDVDLQDADQVEERLREYEFDTEKELLAFLLGIGEACGYCGFRYGHTREEALAGEFDEGS